MRFGTSSKKTWQAVTCALWLAFCALPAQAAIQQMNIVGVGVHPRNPEAEAIALEYAKKRAVFLLAEKWKIPDAAERVAALSPDVLEEAIRGVNVLKLARDGDVLYVNTEVSVQDIPLKRAFGLSVMETHEEADDLTRRGVMVMPVYLPDEELSPVVWGRRNLLIEPIKPLLLRYGRGALVLPVGDRADRSEVDYDNVLHATFRTLDVLVKRYGVKEILMAIVTPGGEKTNEPTRILMHRMLPNESRPEIVQLAAKPEESLQTRMQKAADAIARFASGMSTATAEEERESWQNLPKKLVQLNFTTMQEFGKLQSELGKAPMVKHVALADIQLQRVEGAFYTTASDAALRAYFEKAGMRWQQKDGKWILSYR